MESTEGAAPRRTLNPTPTPIPTAEQGLFSALLVRMIAGTSRWLRGRGLLKTRRFACGLSVCFVCATLRFVFPPMGVKKSALLNDLFTHRPLHVKVRVRVRARVRLGGRVRG